MNALDDDGLMLFAWDMEVACMSNYMYINSIQIYVEVLSLVIDTICRMRTGEGGTLLHTACCQRDDAQDYVSTLIII